VPPPVAHDRVDATHVCWVDNEGGTSRWSYAGRVWRLLSAFRFLPAVVVLGACSGERVDDARTVDALEPPDDWPSHDATCGYSFRGPADLRELPAEGIDSCVELFATSECSLSSDLGCCSNPLTAETGEYRTYASSAVVIDRRSARLVTGVVDSSEDRGEIAAVHFPSIAASGPGGMLTLWIGCATPTARDAIEPLLWSIQFPD
jgi:hypothetical protein